MDTEFARRQMLVQQVRAWDVHDQQVLDVMSSVPREAFVPESYRHLAFADTAIPIGHGQRMMTPTVEGRMLQSLAIAASDEVLEIGTGSGYITACMARLARSVRSLDVYDDFVAAAAGKLKDSGIENVELHCMDACRQLPSGEFDAIAVTASMQHYDPRFAAALRPGGRLFVVVGEPPVQEARLVVCRPDADFSSTVLFETRLDPLLNLPVRNRFRF